MHIESSPRKATRIAPTDVLSFGTGIQPVSGMNALDVWDLEQVPGLGL